MAVIAQNRKRLLYAGGADLTVDGVVINAEQGNESVDVTTFNDAARRNQPGLKTSTVSYSGLFTTGANRSYSVLTDMLGTATAAVSFFANGDGSGQVGVGMSNTYVESDGFQGGPGEAETIDASFMQESEWDNIISLGALGTVTQDTLTGTYDRGAGATTVAGGVMYVHVFGNAASGGNAQWVIHLQHATTATGAYSDVGSITVGSGVTTGTGIAFTGTFNRFVRGSFNEDSTTGTLSVQLSFAAR